MHFDAANHSAVPLRGGYRVETVKGTVRTLGQSEIKLSGHTYAYIKLDLDDGGELMVDKVAVLNSVGSELTAESAGTFHLLRNSKGSSLVAFKGDGGCRGDDIAETARQMRRQKWKLVSMAAVVSVGAVATIIGSIAAPIPAVWGVYLALKPVPSEADIRAAIAASAV